MSTELVISVITVVITFFTLYKAYQEYHKQGVVKKMEVLLQMRTRLRENPNFMKICNYLEYDAEELRDIPLIEKDTFTGFFEELALIKNSGLMNDQVAVYMFGYFAERCSKSENFWYGLNKEEILWSAFFDFAKDMDVAHKNFKYNKNLFKL